MTAVMSSSIKYLMGAVDLVTEKENGLLPKLTTGEHGNFLLGTAF